MGPGGPPGLPRSLLLLVIIVCLNAQVALGQVDLAARLPAAGRTAEVDSSGTRERQNQCPSRAYAVTKGLCGA